MLLSWILRPLLLGMQPLSVYIRLWLYEYLDEHAVRASIAYFRLRRWKHRRKQIRRASETKQLPVVHASPEPKQRVSCLCVSSSAEVREYGKAYAVSNFRASTPDGPHLTACTEAWRSLLSEVAEHSRYTPRSPVHGSKLYYETLGGTIEVSHAPHKHTENPI